MSAICGKTRRRGGSKNTPSLPRDLSSGGRGRGGEGESEAESEREEESENDLFEDIVHPDWKGFALNLYKAARSNDQEAYTVNIKQSPPLHTVLDLHGRTVLHHAVFKVRGGGNVSISYELVILRLEDLLGTSFSLCSSKGSIDLIQTILSVHSGQLLDVADENGWTCSMIAACLGHLDILQVLAQQSPFFPIVSIIIPDTHSPHSH